MTHRPKLSLVTLFGVASSLVAVGCGEAPTEQEAIEIHELIVSDATGPVVEVDHGAVTGSITVAAGDETPDLTFTFIDHDGNTVTTGFAADAVVQNTGVAIFHSTADFEAHFQGISTGSTTVIISLVHSADGDSHHDSPAIVITVN